MSELWAWAVRSYAQPGVAQACLDLQDVHGQSVPLLLWALWRARTGRPPDGRTLTEAAAVAQAWEAAAVGPLRSARRGLKGDLPGAAAEEREHLRSHVKALELEAERRLMQALEALEGVASESRSGAALLAAVSAAWGRPAPTEAFETLAARL